MPESGHTENQSSTAMGHGEEAEAFNSDQMLRLLAEYQHQIAKLESEKNALIQRMIAQGSSPHIGLPRATRSSLPLIHISHSTSPLSHESRSASPGDITDGTTDQECEDEDYTVEGDRFGRSSSGPVRRRHSGPSQLFRSRSNSLTVSGLQSLSRIAKLTAISDPSRGGRPSGFSDEVRSCIVEYMAVNPNHTQQEVTDHIRSKLGLTASRPTVCRWIAKIRKQSPPDLTSRSSCESLSLSPSSPLTRAFFGDSLTQSSSLDNQHSTKSGRDSFATAFNDQEIVKALLDEASDIDALERESSSLSCSQSSAVLRQEFCGLTVTGQALTQLPEIRVEDAFDDEEIRMLLGAEMQLLQFGGLEF